MGSGGVTMASPRVTTRWLNLEQVKLARGFQAQDHRASVARAYRREAAGETVARCGVCGCEVDVETAAHAIRCSEHG